MCEPIYAFISFQIVIIQSEISITHFFRTFYFVSNFQSECLLLPSLHTGWPRSLCCYLDSSHKVHDCGIITTILIDYNLSLYCVIRKKPIGCVCSIVLRIVPTHKHFVTFNKGFRCALKLPTPFSKKFLRISAVSVFFSSIQRFARHF